MNATSKDAAPDETIWAGSKSQVVNTIYFAACILAFVLVSLITHKLLPWASRPTTPQFVLWALLAAEVIPIVLLLKRWLSTNAISYELTAEQLHTQNGILSQNVNTLELYRVRDYTLDKPFFLRLLGFSTIVLQTSDLTTPIVRIEAIRGGQVLLNEIRERVEACRVKKGVREIDTIR